MAPERFPISELHSLPGLTPKLDGTFGELINKAAEGSVDVYFAAVPLVLCIPYDVDYRPDKHPVGRIAIDQEKKNCHEGNFANLHVYQRGAWFVVSDDYIPLFAALEGNPDYLPCFIYGKPDSKFVIDVQGPIAVEDVREMLGR